MKRTNYLVCYDIRHPRRIRQVARLLERSAMRIQYSVFLATLSPSEHRELIEQLSALLDHRADDLRIYPLHRNAHTHNLGQPILQSGIMLISSSNDPFLV